MLSEKLREDIALKRFSLISPVLNGQVKNQKEYFENLCLKPIDMPYYGSRVYSPKTLRSWLHDYRKGGLEGLKPGYRADRGRSRKVTPEIAERIREKRAQMPRITNIMLYEELIEEGVIRPENLSRSTFYRFLQANPELAQGKELGSTRDKELKRFSHQWINELWQTDVMYGPYLKVGKTKKQTYLFGYIDDASRLITHGQFFFTQGFLSMRSSFKEAVLKRGIPKMLYTDNAAVYRSKQMSILCAGIGCSLIHAEPFTPNSKGKIERFFHTVRLRFLPKINPIEIKTIEELNMKFWHWLEEDYQRKLHSALDMSPLDFFMSQTHRVNIVSDPKLLDEQFLLRVNRKVNHDATLSVDKVLYETDPTLSNSRVEVRYDPQWLENPTQVLLLFREGQKVGEARQVNFHDNARVKRKGPGRPLKNANVSDAKDAPKASISFSSFNDESEISKDGES